MIKRPTVVKLVAVSQFDNDVTKDRRKEPTSEDANYRYLFWTLTNEESKTYKPVHYEEHIKCQTSVYKKFSVYLLIRDDT